MLKKCSLLLSTLSISYLVSATPDISHLLYNDELGALQPSLGSNVDAATKKPTNPFPITDTEEGDVDLKLEAYICSYYRLYSPFN